MERQRGQVVVLFTLAFVVILAVAAVVVDLGLLRTDGARLQNALDAASLAAAHSMPVNSSNVSSVSGVATRYVNENFSGNWSLQPIAYRCLIGLSTTTGLPRTTDMPSACNVSFAASSASWKCTGATCWAPCDPVHIATDVCNTIVLAASTTRSYSFGRAIGISSGTDGGSNTGSDGGSVGNRLAAACNGLCGNPPTKPLDVVLIVDRTGSMLAQMSSLRTAADAVLDAYNPAYQRVALGTLGPSTATTTCGSPATSVNAMTADTPNVSLDGSSSDTTYTSTTVWANATTASTGGASSLAVSTPASTAAGDVLVAAISVSGGSGVLINAPNSSWHLINRTDNSTLVSVASYYRVATGTDSASYTWTFGSSVRAIGTVSRYSGIDNTNPVDVAGTDGTNSFFSSNLVSAPAITTTANNDRVIGFFAIAANTTFTAPTSLSERMDLGVFNGPTLEVSDTVVPSPVYTGTVTATAGTSNRWAAHLVALRPAITSSPSVILARPGGTVAGDVLVVGISVSGGSATTITSPSGWTLIRRTDNSTTSSLASYYRVATASEPASYTWTVGGSARSVGILGSYSGVDTTKVIDPTASSGSMGTGSTGSSTSATATGITTTVPYDQVIGLFETAATTSFSVPSGMTERGDVPYPGSAGPTLEMSDVQAVATGATGNKTATAVATGAWAAQLFALRAQTAETYGIDPTDPNALTSWIPLGFSGTDTMTPTFTDPGVRGYKEAFSSGGVPASTSHLAQAIGCFDTSATGTNLATPITMADYYLMHYGRPGEKKGIIFETDGTPSSCPLNFSAATCAMYTDSAAQAAADAAKADGITLFTIGYSGSGGVDATLLGNMASTKVGTSTCTAAENTDGDDFFCTPTASELATIFEYAAAALAGGPHLVQLYAVPAVTAVSPSSGSHTGGSTVTITGVNLGDAYSVTFSGTAASFSANSATSITAIVPAHAGTGTVDIQVSTPGGSSSLVTADHFTYN